MSEPFIGEIRIFGFNFAPRGWLFCRGQTPPIQQYSALFAVIGTSYGGDGQTNFGIPNFQSNAPMGWGNGPGLTPRTIGEVSGSASVTLTAQQIPAHTHALNGLLPTSAPTQAFATPTNNASLGVSTSSKLFAPPPATTTMSSQAIGLAGGSGPHDNQQPSLALNFCIATEGVFPTRN
ncbi:MAG: tail fiber protein [Sphingomonas sp.]|nr:tail fiber protein [Sphingomonas sp.]